MIFQNFVWIGISGITGGYFFPSHDFLHKSILSEEIVWDKNVLLQNVITYKDYLGIIKGLCSRLIEREGRWGSHVGRKTGYLFGVWGGGQDADLMQCARHKTIKNALKYKKDAAFLLELANANNSELTLRAPKWRSLYCENNQLAMSLNFENRSNYKSLQYLSAFFVREQLGFRIKDFKKCATSVAAALLKYSHKYGLVTEAKTEINKLLLTLPPEVGSRLSNLIARLNEEIISSFSIQNLHLDNELAPDLAQETSVLSTKKKPQFQSRQEI